MAEKVLARRTSVDVMFGGTDITNDIKPYLTSIVYTDDADDLADDLKIQIQDRAQRHQLQIQDQVELQIQE